MSKASLFAVCVMAVSVSVALADTKDSAPDTTGDQPTTAAVKPGNSGLESHSLPGELLEDDKIEEESAYRKLGPTAVSDVKFLMDTLRLGKLFDKTGIRTFGWIDSGYTGTTSGSGMLNVQPRQNRYGDAVLLNQIGFVLQKPLRQDRLDFGFNVRFFMGADAALGQPKGGIDNPPGNNRFSYDFRDLYVSAHLPIITEGGMDVKVGRMNTIIGYNGFLAPYRPFYSSDYQFFYSQDGAFTGALTTLHVSKQLDVANGITFGANTFFSKRSSNSICYIGQVNYWLTEENKTRLTGSLHLGENAIFAAPGLAGDFDTVVELRVQHNWSDKVTQVVQSNMGWDANTPRGTGQWYGLYTIGIWHWIETLDLQARADWFADIKGTRTGIDTQYGALTLGVNWHPVKYLELRPEIRGDFAGDSAYGGDNQARYHSQLTGVVSALLKF